MKVKINILELVALLNCLLHVLGRESFGSE